MAAIKVNTHLNDNQSHATWFQLVIHKLVDVAHGTTDTADFRHDKYITLIKHRQYYLTKVSILIRYLTRYSFLLHFVSSFQIVTIQPFVDCSFLLLQCLLFSRDTTVYYYFLLWLIIIGHVCLCVAAFVRTAKVVTFCHHAVRAILTADVHDVVFYRCATCIHDFCCLHFSYLLSYLT